MTVVFRFLMARSAAARAESNGEAIVVPRPGLLIPFTCNTFAEPFTSLVTIGAVDGGLKHLLL